FEGLIYENVLPFWGAISFLVFGNSIVGILLMFTMVRQGSIAKVASVMFMVPGVAAFIAWLVTDEVPRLITIPGFILAMLGALWTNRIVHRTLPTTSPH
ncbi:MAG: drug/metabolite transporter (DMT)-like permease, partial [Paraglaciecola sp.]